jgi:hypothetical protein
MQLNQAKEIQESVFGIYHTGDQAARGVEDLLTAGFSNDDISVLLPGSHSSRSLSHEKASKAPEGTTAGVVGGGLLGGTLGLLAGLGMLSVPGIGQLIAVGPIVAALAGVGAGGTVGGLIGALVGMGIPEYEAKRYEGQLKAGGVLLSVHCNSKLRLEKALMLLRQTGAQDIAHTSEAKADYPARVQEVLRF